MPRRLPTDVTAEILCRLPAKIVVRFRVACRDWLSLTTDSHFLTAHVACNPAPPPSVLFIGFPLRCLSLRGAPPCLPDPSLSFLPDRHHTVESACGGLLLLRRPWCSSARVTYYVCNPTTMESAKIPPLPVPAGGSMLHLAFDPSQSPHYEIFAVSGFRTRAVSIYSSRTGEWRPYTALTAFPVHKARYRMHAFHRGSLFWKTMDPSTLLVLDVEAGRWRRLYLPRHGSNPTVLRHIGVSCGRLNIIRTDKKLSDRSQLRVWELEPCGTSWSLLHVVDVGSLMDAVNKWSAKPRTRMAFIKEEGLIILKHDNTVVSHNIKDGSIQTIYKPSPSDRRFLYSDENKDFKDPYSAYEIRALPHSFSPLFF